MGLGSSVLMMFRSTFVQCDRNARSEIMGLQGIVILFLEANLAFGCLHCVWDVVF